MENSRKYDPQSSRADEFICDAEILDTIEYAGRHSNDKALAESILAKAAECKGLTHREAAVLMECDDPEITERIYSLAKEIKRRL